MAPVCLQVNRPLYYYLTYRDLAKSNIKYVYTGPQDSSKSVFLSVREKAAEDFADRVHSVLHRRQTPWEKFQSSRKLRLDYKTNEIKTRDGYPLLCSRSRLNKLASQLSRRRRIENVKWDDTDSVFMKPSNVLHWEPVNEEDNTTSTKLSKKSKTRRNRSSDEEYSPTSSADKQRKPCTVLNWTPVDGAEVDEISKRLSKPTFNTYVRRKSKSKDRLSPTLVFHYDKRYLKP